MAELFASGQIIDIILALVGLEAAALGLYRWKTGRGVALSEIGLNLISGVCLMLALRSALVAEWWGWTAAWLTAALIAHGADLVRVWRK